MTVTRSRDGWIATIQNNTDHILPQARMVVGQRIYDLASLPSHQSKTFPLNTAKGDILANFVNQHFSSFQQAVQSRRNNFGNNSEPIRDVADGAMAVSFLGAMDQTEGGWNSFQIFRSLDLTRYSGADHAILLAWDPGQSPAAPLNHFAAKRSHRDSLLRLVVPVKEM
jgi:hypothetical protein